MLGHRSVLRDVIARYAVHVDDAPLTRLDKKINKLSDNIKRFGAITATAFTAAAYGAYQLAEAASSAEETFAGLGELFGKQGALQVRDWAKRTGDEMSRSEYMLEKSAFDFGKFLTPQLKDPELVSQWSKRLSKLAVDLASFNDTSDPEAMMRLFSGVSGETEAVRRLGIDISDTALDNLNKSKGGKSGGKRLASLTLAEKTLLRMEKIMIDSEKAQGDAVRSADRWAGRLKRVQGVLHRMAVVYGTKLLPYGVKFLKFLEHALGRAEHYLDIIVDKTSTWGALLLMSKVAAAALAIHLGRAVLWTAAMDILWGKMNSKILRTASVIGGLTVAFMAIEDALTFANGRDNKSFYGTLAQGITGLQKPLDLLELNLTRMDNLIFNIGEGFRLAGVYAMGLVHAQGGRIDQAKAAFGERGNFRTTSTIGLIEEKNKQADAHAEAAVRAGNLSVSPSEIRFNEDKYTTYLRKYNMKKAQVEAAGQTSSANDVVEGFLPYPRFIGPTGNWKSETGGVRTGGDWEVTKGAGGNVTIQNHVTIEAGGDAKEAKRLFDAETDKALRQAKQALGRQGGN